jgi:predicted transcriptional regulator
MDKTRLEKFRQRIKEIMDDEFLTIDKMAEFLDLTYFTLYNFLHERHVSGKTTMAKINKYLENKKKEVDLDKKK